MLGLVAAALIGLGTAAHAQHGVALTHVHGLAYSADGKRILIPSHHGLATYERQIPKAADPQHDYMDSQRPRHLYSSGHPAPGSGLVNPFGVIRSRDGGRTWDKLGLEGETDFHLLATGWNTSAIYVWNPAPSSRMRKPGLHYTLNEGFAWKPAKAAGLQGEPNALAVHPDDTATVSIASSKGIYLSRDSGERFAPVLERAEGLAVFFDLDGKHLWASTFDGRPQLVRMPLVGGAPAPATLPRLTDDAVAYIAQNPAARSEYAIATFARSVYVSKDAGRNWLQLANRGKTQ
jgi:hypothetical protein